MTILGDITDQMEKLKDLLTDDFKELEQDKLYEKLTEWEAFQTIETDFTNIFKNIKPVQMNEKTFETGSFSCETEDLIYALENIRSRIIRKSSE